MTDIPDADRPNTGGWAPQELSSGAPIFVWPPAPGALLKWLFGWQGYLFPYNALYMAIAAVTWWWLVPDLSRMQRLEFGWIAWLFVQNLVLLVVWISLWHLRLYVQRRQGVEFKYNSRWPKDTQTFLFGSQLPDNVFWTLCSAVPIWTAYLVLTLWAMANGWIPYLDMRAHPIYFALFMFFIPVFREIHFYVVHRMSHWPLLYRWVHSIHHKNSNPGPWSGLAMHPVEHLMYFSAVLIHWVIPSNPLLVVFHLQHLAFAPAPDHSGFGKVVINGKTQLNAATYMHYLHHRYFEVNYGGDGSVPIDRWFGTWHDGSMAAHNAMNERFKKKTGKA